jgi:ABC-type transport system involved in multi-copper enzyme maturation permease subunit
MRPALKSEFKKLLTIRSAYVITLSVILITGLATYLSTGPVVEIPANQQQQAAPQQPSPPDKTAQTKSSAPAPAPKVVKQLPPEKVLSNLSDAIQPMSLLMAIIVILLMAHEYRYNTITYTLTASNRRSKVLASKLIVGVSVITVLTLLMVLASIVTTYLAVSVKGLTLPFPDANWAYIIGRLLFYSLGMGLLGLAFITLLRNLTAALVLLFFLPAVEVIFSNLLVTHNVEPAKFLPFSALNQVANIVGGQVSDKTTPVTLAHCLVVFSLYLIPLWIVSWYLFIKRDAN